MLAAKAMTGEAISMDKLREYINDAERILSGRNISSVQDLNLGDLANMEELYMAFECFQGTSDELSFSAFPNIANLLSICQDIEEFKEVHKPFLAFCEKYRQIRDGSASKGSLQTAIDLVADTGRSLVFIPWAIWNMLLFKFAPFGPRQLVVNKKSII